MDVFGEGANASVDHSTTRRRTFIARSSSTLLMLPRCGPSMCPRSSSSSRTTLSSAAWVHGCGAGGCGGGGCIIEADAGGGGGLRRL